jgi:twitching motility protein PilT
VEIVEVLNQVFQAGASDLHLKVPNIPLMRKHGLLSTLDTLPPLTDKEAETILEQVTTPEQRLAFINEQELDFAYEITGVARFRVNVMQQRGTLSMAFRLVPFNIPTIEELCLPEICKELIQRPRGLILVTGPTGSGKSTTLAAMINYLNKNERRTVITIEDPIEFVYCDDKCSIAQRELGMDTKSFACALKHALRHDPNVIVLGEMRDLDTISTAMAAAETGHLVLGTIHTIDAPQTVDRLIDMFPPEQHQQVRLQFSQIIEGVISQTLVQKASGTGRMGAFEVMIGLPAVRNLIREGKTFELPNIMEMATKEGMQLLEQDLARLVNKGIIRLDEAKLKSSNHSRLTKILQTSP